MGVPPLNSSELLLPMPLQRFLPAFHPDPIVSKSVVAQMGKNLTAMQETWVQSLYQEDPGEKEMTSHSSILAGKIPATVVPGRL